MSLKRKTIAQLEEIKEAYEQLVELEVDIQHSKEMAEQVERVLGEKENLAVKRLNAQSKAYEGAINSIRSAIQGYQKTRKEFDFTKQEEASYQFDIKKMQAQLQDIQNQHTSYLKSSYDYILETPIRYSF